ncbi:unnamed protein product [Blepharisma stoltei]|uniref:Uncharacterized protein n=1 Tax=Blepharisma stoltei TaxID=1481888 RepID=A0AAU9IFU3_9CILI|nr:unnamed protein product [Blepharisma stoltei]
MRWGLRNPLISHFKLEVWGLRSLVSRIVEYRNASFFTVSYTNSFLSFVGASLNNETSHTNCHGEIMMI